MDREVQVTPLPLVGQKSEDSGIIEFPAETVLMRVGKIAGAITGILALIGAIVAVPMWLVGKVEASETSVQKDVKEQLGEHEKHPHAGAVPREVYDIHVQTQKEANKEAKTERKEIRKVLDLIGQQTYRSPAKWQKTLKKEGLEKQ